MLAPVNAREKILDAAMDVVRAEGVASLTLDAAARVAGVSKGGILYHFPSKDALIGGMIDRLIAQCEDLSVRYYDQEPDGPYRWARALVNACFDAASPINDPVGGALLAAVAFNPRLIAPVVAQYRQWDDRLRRDSPDPDRAHLIAAAMDGLYFQKLMGVCVLDRAALDRLKAHAISLLRSDPGP